MEIMGFFVCYCFFFLFIILFLFLVGWKHEHQYPLQGECLVLYVSFSGALSSDKIVFKESLSMQLNVFRYCLFKLMF